MHHALLLNDVLGIGCHIDNHRVVLRKASFEICFLPFELFILAIWYGHSIVHVSHFRTCILISSWETKELEMHILDEVELSVPWLVINFLRVVVVLHCKHLDIV